MGDLSRTSTILNCVQLLNSYRNLADCHFEIDELIEHVTAI